jgi:arabinofuranosyltransferase
MSRILIALCLASVVGLVLVAAWHDRNMAVDDAYITFRYAENLREGHGLRWNPDSQPCEGYSNFSYVVLIAALGMFGLDPWIAALLLASASLLGIAWLIWRSAVPADRWAPLAVAPALLLFARGEVQIHASRGLETCLFAFLCVAQVATAARLASTRLAGRLHAVFAALCGTALFMTRPDGVLVSVCCWLGVAWMVRRRRDARARLLLTIGIWLLSGGLYAVWKLYVFGYLLPNPFYMKSGGARFEGIDETLAFLHSYAWLLGVLVVAAVVALLRRPAEADAGSASTAASERDPAVFLALIVTVAWLAYGSKIVHEIGFSHRFVWPAAAVAALGSARGLATLRGLGSGWRIVPVLAWCALVSTLVLGFPTLRSHVKLLGDAPRSDVYSTTFLRLGRAIASTGIAPSLTLYCSHAGATPFAAGAHHVDPAGLVDNGYCLRTPIEERAAYASSVLDDLDIIAWAQYPASPGAESFDEDPRASTSTYLNQWCLGDDPGLDTGLRKAVARAAQGQRKKNMYGYMKILRQYATLVGEMNTGIRRWRSFVYVWKASPHHDRLVKHLRQHVDISVEDIDYDGWPK